jgi:hypothetical protein
MERPDEFVGVQPHAPVVCGRAAERPYESYTQTGNSPLETSPRVLLLNEYCPK